MAIRQLMWPLLPPSGHPGHLQLCHFWAALSREVTRELAPLLLDLVLSLGFSGLDPLPCLSNQPFCFLCPGARLLWFCRPDPIALITHSRQQGSWGLKKGSYQGKFQSPSRDHKSSACAVI